MRKLCLGILALAAASTARAAVVTYTLRLNEGPTGAFQAGSFAVWATVSGGDNFGLATYGVDLNSGAGEGGNATVAQRSPGGTWDVDDTDLDWSPDVIYPTKQGGFTLVRTSNSAAVYSASQDLLRTADLDVHKVMGMGQTPGAMNTIVPTPFKNPDNSEVSWQPYRSISGANVAYGTPPNSPFPPLPAGSIRLFTGTSTNLNALQIQPTTDTKAAVWRNNLTSGPDALLVDIPQIQLQTSVCGCPGFAKFTLEATGTGTNQAVGGAITVTGSNGNYVSEVDQLVSNVAAGNAPIATINGADGGFVYVMAKLTGTQAQIDAFLSDPSVTADVGAADGQFAPLHAAYDALFGAGGFNALFKFNNQAGIRTINWDAVSFGVTVDQLAAVPEPGSMLWAAFVGINLLHRRRRID